MAAQIKIAIRGADIQWSGVCYDSSGVQYTPVTANITLSYYVSGVFTQVTNAMSINGSTGVITSVFSTTACDATSLTWFIKATGAANSVAEGEISLVKNSSNPGP